MRSLHIKSPERFICQPGQHIECQYQVRFMQTDPLACNIARSGSDSEVTVDSAVLLSEAGHVVDGSRLELEVRRHCKDSGDGYDAGTANASDHDREGGSIDTARGRKRHPLNRRIAYSGKLGPTESPPVHRHKRRTKTTGPTLILVPATP